MFSIFWKKCRSLLLILSLLGSTNSNAMLSHTAQLMVDTTINNFTTIIPAVGTGFLYFYMRRSVMGLGKKIDRNYREIKSVNEGVKSLTEQEERHYKEVLNKINCAEKNILNRIDTANREHCNKFRAIYNEAIKSNAKVDRLQNTVGMQEQSLYGINRRFEEVQRSVDETNETSKATLKLLETLATCQEKKTRQGQSQSPEENKVFIPVEKNRLLTDGSNGYNEKDSMFSHEQQGAKKKEKSVLCTLLYGENSA